MSFVSMSAGGTFFFQNRSEGGQLVRNLAHVTCWELSGFIAQGWGPGLIGGWPEVTGAHPRQTFMPQSNGDSSFQRRQCSECTAVLKYFEESTIFSFVKKDARENQEKHGSNILDKRQSSLHRKHVKDWQKKNHHSKMSARLDSPDLSLCSLSKVSLLIPQMLYFLNSENMCVPAYHSN